MIHGDRNLFVMCVEQINGPILRRWFGVNCVLCLILLLGGFEEDRSQQNARDMGDSAQAVQDGLSLVVESLAVRGANVSAGNIDVLVEVEGITKAEIEEIWNEVTGPIDRWWRSEDWISRECIRVCTPAELYLCVAELHTKGLVMQFQRLGELIEELDDPNAIRTLRSGLETGLLGKVAVTRSPRAEDLADLYRQLGITFIQEYRRNSGAEHRTLTVWENAAQERVASFVKSEISKVSTLSQVIEDLQDVKHEATGGDLEDERSVAVRWCEAYVLMMEARLVGIESTRLLLADTFSIDQIVEILDDLRGPIDAVWTVVRSGGNVEELVHEELQAPLAGVKIQLAAKSIADTYHSKSRILNQRSARRWLRDDYAQRDLSAPPKLPEISTDEIWADALDMGMMSIDAGLIVGGVAGASVSGGWSLLASAAGVLHLTFDSVYRAISASAGHIEETVLLVAVQKAAIMILVGDVSTQSKPSDIDVVAKVSMVFPVRMEEPSFMTRCDSRFLEGTRPHIANMEKLWAGGVK